MTANATDPNARDAMIEGLLDEALLDYDGEVTPEVLAEMREALGDLLAAHPDGQAMLRQLEADPVIDKSGTLGRDEEADARDRKAGG